MRTDAETSALRQGNTQVAGQWIAFEQPECVPDGVDERPLELGQLTPCKSSNAAT